MLANRPGAIPPAASRRLIERRPEARSDRIEHNTIAIALGLHVRVGIEDNIWRRKGERMTSVQPVEQMVYISREIGRDVATGSEAPDIYQIGVQYSLTEETLAKLGMVPNREPGQRGFPVRAIAA